MQLLRLFEDDKGESDFDIVECPMTLLDNSPPAKPHFFSMPEPATAWTCVRCPSDWDGGLHPAPRRQIVICTAGSIRISSSLGDAREIIPGGSLLLEDTKGKGHISEVTSDQPFEAVIIRLD